MRIQVFNNSNVESMYMTNGTTQILLSDTSKDEKYLLSNWNMNGLSIAKIFLKQYLNELIHYRIKINEKIIFIAKIIVLVSYRKLKELKNHTKDQIF